MKTAITRHFYVQHRDMIVYPAKNYQIIIVCRMCRPSFEELLTKGKPEIRKYDTNMRDAVPPVAMIAIIQRAPQKPNTL